MNRKELMLALIAGALAVLLVVMLVLPALSASGKAGHPGKAGCGMAAGEKCGEQAMPASCPMGGKAQATAAAGQTSGESKAATGKAGAMEGCPMHENAAGAKAEKK